MTEFNQRTHIEEVHRAKQHYDQPYFRAQEFNDLFDGFGFITIL